MVVTWTVPYTWKAERNPTSEFVLLRANVGFRFQAEHTDAERPRKSGTYSQGLIHHGRSDGTNRIEGPDGPKNIPKKNGHVCSSFDWLCLVALTALHDGLAVSTSRSMSRRSRLTKRLQTYVRCRKGGIRAKYLVLTLMYGPGSKKMNTRDVYGSRAGPELEVGGSVVRRCIHASSWCSVI